MSLELVLTHMPPHKLGVAPEQPMPQAPPEQDGEPVPTLGPGQTLPQLPQLLGSVLVLTHAPLQPDWPAPQQTEFMHAFCPMHLLPHAPQLLLSVVSLTQAPLHEFGVDPAQARPHLLPEHVAEPVPALGAGQTLPHAPQLLVLVDVSMHTPPQLVCPAGQQSPDEQLFPAPHAFPQPPQLLLSVLVLTQAPPHKLGVEPEHVMPHEPPEHVAEPVPELGPGQTLPQLPQLLGSVLVVTQAPPHPVCPAPQHTLPVQDLPPVHFAPQPPQLLLSVVSSTHALPHRFGVEPEHVMPHVLPEQVAEPAPELGPEQTVVQDPQ
jgi:hypothetical protein